MSKTNSVKIIIGADSGYPKFRNDRGVPEICIGVKEFMCIGESPPQDPSVGLRQYGRGDAGLTRELLDWVFHKRP
jgi:hypothetical protein